MARCIYGVRSKFSKFFLVFFAFLAHSLASLLPQRLMECSSFVLAGGTSFGDLGILNCFC